MNTYMRPLDIMHSNYSNPCAHAGKGRLSDGPPLTCMLCYWRYTYVDDPCAPQDAVSLSLWLVENAYVKTRLLTASAA